MKRIIFFDGVCNLCNGLVDFILKKDHKNQFYFCSLQSKYAEENVPSQYKGLDTVVLLEDTKAYTQSTAILRILFELGGWWNIFAMLASILPTSFRDVIYRMIARNRYRLFGKKDTCRFPTAEEKNRFIE